AWVIVYIIFLLWTISLLFPPFWRPCPRESKPELAHSSYVGLNSETEIPEGLTADVDGRITDKKFYGNYVQSMRDSYLMALGTTAITLTGFGWSYVKFVFV
ncbi:hypothetical protein HK096_006921, partial [Nowakowskiella sp. JEL0078]